MFVGTITLVIVFVASRTLAEEISPNYASSGKRSPMEFQTIEDGKSLMSSENEELGKRAPKGFQGMRGKKDTRHHNEEHFVIDDEYEKRSPMDSPGIRGKKDFLTPDFSDSYIVDEYFKRAPMGFQGMRGKKAISSEDYYKRAAMGFQGMRGKKSLELLLDEIDNARYDDDQVREIPMLEYPEEYEKRAPSMGFQGMRGKRDEFEDVLEKRAPMGFQGMRGKKSLIEAINDLEKRAMMGFQGMRGKRNLPIADYDEYRPEREDSYSAIPKYFYDKDADLKKKRLKMGFIGSRGRRSESNGRYPKMSTYDLQDALADEIAGDLTISTRDEIAERMNVTPLRFYKKSAYGYTGTRGKKIPRWEIRGKFIGVRGKKLSKTNYDDNGDSLDNVHSNNERIGVKTGTTTKLEMQ